MCSTADRRSKNRQDLTEVETLLNDAKRLAKRYKELTGKPLGITGEVAEFTAAALLDIELTEARQAGYDAIRWCEGKEIQIQIKSRCLPSTSTSGQRLGGIQLNKEWDVVLMVLLDEDLEVLKIYEADRSAISSALLEPGSKARNERGALSVNKFKTIGHQVWPLSQTE